jgi:hypothetical protein
MAFEVTRQEILKQAIELKKLYDKTRVQKYKDEEIRLRKIVTELEAFTGGGGSGVTQILAGTNVTVSPAGGTGIVTVNATGGGGATTLDGLSDVTISAPANGQVLTYNSTTTQWENQTPGGGGGGGDMYKSTYDVDNDGIVDGSETTQIIVRNSTGSTLLKGQVVYLSGATGNRPNAVLSRADTEATATKTIGIVVANINNNSDGYVAVSGTLHNLNTSAFADGVAVWLSATTAGGMTSTIPAEPNHTVFIGYVARSHPTQGRLVIVIQNGYELNELHGVLISAEANNDLLVYESSTSLWKNKTFSAIFGGTPLVSVPTLAQVTTAGNTTTNAITVGGLTVATNLIATDIGNSRVGIGTTSPLTKLYVEGTNVTQIGVKSTTNSGAGGYIAYNDVGSSYEFGMWGSTRGGFGAISSGNSYLYGSVDLAITTTQNLKFGVGSGVAERMRIVGSTGNVLINTTADFGAKLSVIGFVRVQGLGSTTATTSLEITNSAGLYSSLLVRDNGNIYTNGSITAASALARGVFFNNTLVAAANNDVLVGLDISTNITAGAFTGLRSYGLRIVGDNLAFQPSTTTKIPLFVTSNNNTRLIISSTATGASFNTGFSLTQGNTFKWSLASYGTNADFVFFNDVTNTNSLFITGNTNNVLINTTTDAGFKLDVNGTARVQGDFTVDTNTLFVDATNDRVGIGTTTFPTITGTLKLFVDGSGSGSNGRTFFAVRNTSSSSAANFSLINSAGKLLNAQISGPSYTTGEQAGFFTQGAIPLYFMTDGGVLSGGTSRILFYAGGYGVSPTMTITPGNTGNVLIGTTTDTGHKLRVNGTVSAALSNVTHTNQVYYNTATGELTYGALPTTVGYTGIVTIVTNPPGQQNLDFQNGLLVNVF